MSFLIRWKIGNLRYVWNQAPLFLTSSLLTALSFLIIGFLKPYITEQSKFKGMLETLLLGGSASVLAYVAGTLLERWFL